MSQPYRRSLLFIGSAVILMITAAIVTDPVLASPHLLRLTYNNRGTCSTDQFLAMGTLSASAGAVLSEVDQVNGLTVFQGLPQLIQGKVIYSNGSLSRFFTNLALPYFILETFTATFPDGQTLTAVVYGTCRHSGLTLFVYPGPAVAHSLTLTYSGGGTCSTDQFLAQGTLSVSTGGTLSEVDQVNGVTVFQGSPQLIKGHVIYSDGSLSQFLTNLSLPYSIKDTFTATFPDGQTRITMLQGTCTRAGRLALRVTVSRWH